MQGFEMAAMAAMAEQVEQVDRRAKRNESTGRGGRRLASGALVALVGGLVLTFASAATAAAAPTDPTPDKISITHTPGVAIGGCITQLQLSYTVRRSGSMFQLRILAPARPCAPITATAVIYAMPGKGVAWPQTLEQAAPFTISAAGTTTVTFTKDCTPAQFDVVTGATPDRISPFGGVLHGPLLFPGDTETAFQDVGAVCVDSSTTTAAVTTTTIVRSSTSVAGATTTVLGATTSASTTSTTAKVLGTSTDKSDPSGTADASLAATGTSPNSTAIGGGLLVAIGLATLVVARRREDPQAHMITSAPSVSERSPFSID